MSTLDTRMGLPEARTESEVWYRYNNLQFSRGVAVVNVLSGATKKDYLYIRIEGYDEATDVWFPIAVSEDITSNKGVVLATSPDKSLTKTFRVSVVKNSLEPITYSVGFEFITD